MTGFDRYVVVDWSANGTPKGGKDSIWVASYGRDGLIDLTNPRTRAAAMDWVVAGLRTAMEREERVLLGFDAAFGYPSGFANRIGLRDGPAWSATWAFLASRIQDDHENVNNRFEVAAAMNARIGGDAGPFWGRPTNHRYDGLLDTKCSFPCAGLAELRATEVQATKAHARPKSVWQLFYPGSVGSQTLTLLPALERLRTHRDLVDLVRVWPFETGFTREPWADARIIVAEVWPSALPASQIAAVDHPVLDARQVTALAHCLEARDRSGELADWFEVPGLDAETTRVAIEEEGWILWAPGLGGG